jgi:hypothetical protein
MNQTPLEHHPTPPRIKGAPMLLYFMLGTILVITVFALGIFGGTPGRVPGTP